jgi:hypothetical protein
VDVILHMGVQETSKKPTPFQDLLVRVLTPLLKLYTAKQVGESNREIMLFVLFVYVVYVCVGIYLALCLSILLCVYLALCLSCFVFILLFGYLVLFFFRKYAAHRACACFDHPASLNSVGRAADCSWIVISWSPVRIQQ